MKRRWTKGKPTTPGWYFIALKGHSHSDIVHFERIRDDVFVNYAHLGANMWVDYGTNWERHINDMDITHHERIEFPDPPEAA